MLGFYKQLSYFLMRNWTILERKKPNKKGKMAKRILGTLPKRQKRKLILIEPEF